jgi:hypothetical protein
MILVADMPLYVELTADEVIFSGGEEVIHVPRAHIPATSAALRRWATDAMAGRLTDKDKPEEVITNCMMIKLEGMRCCDITAVDDDFEVHADGGFDIILTQHPSCRDKPVYPISADRGTVRLSPAQALRVADLLAPRRRIE